MAPAANLPEVDMSMTQQLDVLQTYWLLFDHMKEDFVHKDDLKVILATNNVTGAAPLPDHIVKGLTTFSNMSENTAAKATAVVYNKLAKTGGVATDEAIKALEKITP